MDSMCHQPQGLGRIPSIDVQQKIAQDASKFSATSFARQETSSSPNKSRSFSYVDVDERLAQSALRDVHAGFVYSPVSVESLMSIANSKHENQPSYVITRKDDALRSQRLFKSASVLSMWFFCSFMTIFLNKYILSTLDGDPGILGECQILMTAVFGMIVMYLPCWQSKRHPVSSVASVSRYQFFVTVSLLGWMRFGAVVCSVVSLKYVAVSFSETIKSSAPLFTVVIAYILLGEQCGVKVTLSLVPIMLGLAMSTGTEVSFHLTGFLAAVANNVLDCLQNVFSKKLLTGEQKYSPMELQFYTSVAATVVQMPFWFLFLDIHAKLSMIDRYMSAMLLLDTLFFYFQSLAAYLLMSLISPVTFSVAGTVKRVVLIWFSVLVFGNHVTLLSGFGTVLVVIGVALYQRARSLEVRELERKLGPAGVGEESNGKERC